MKNAKKILERKRKIVVVLVVMVSFVSVLAWYQMKKAHAYQSYNTGGNKHFKDGHLTVNINGPNGKSDSLTMYIHSDEYEKNKNVSGALCCVPSKSPGPRNFKSASAISKPSFVRTIISSRLRVSSVSL